jgi:hypothetical protein
MYRDGWVKEDDLRPKGPIDSLEKRERVSGGSGGEGDLIIAEAVKTPIIEPGDGVSEKETGIWRVSPRGGESRNATLLSCGVTFLFNIPKTTIGCPERNFSGKKEK